MPFRWMYFINLKSVSYQKLEHQIMFLPYEPLWARSSWKKIYAWFVDFKKAFDSVWHEGLLHKLLQIDVGGCFYELIQNPYSNSSCTLKIGSSQTRPFHYLRGVRQGCILSSLLFNLYINDLPYAFQNTLSDPIILPNGTKLNSLLYADDWLFYPDPK